MLQKSNLYTLSNNYILKLCKRCLMCNIKFLPSSFFRHSFYKGTQIYYKFSQKKTQTFLFLSCNGSFQNCHMRSVFSFFRHKNALAVNANHSESFGPFSFQSTNLISFHLESHSRVIWAPHTFFDGINKFFLLPIFPFHIIFSSTRP
jgi:hypothetical protein